MLTGGDKNLADVICERSHIEAQFKVNSPISIKCMYEIAVLAKIFLKYVIYSFINISRTSPQL